MRWIADCTECGQRWYAWAERSPMQCPQCLVFPRAEDGMREALRKAGLYTPDKYLEFICEGDNA